MINRDLNVRHIRFAVATAGLLAALGTEADARWTHGYQPPPPAA